MSDTTIHILLILFGLAEFGFGFLLGANLLEREDKRGRHRAVRR